MKTYTIILASALLAGCIGSSTAFTNRSVTYMYTPSIDGKSNTLTEQPKANDATVNAEKLAETKANVSSGDIKESSSNELAKSKDEAK